MTGGRGPDGERAWAGCLGEAVSSNGVENGEPPRRFATSDPRHRSSIVVGCSGSAATGLLPCELVHRSRRSRARPVGRGLGRAAVAGGPALVRWHRRTGVHGRRRPLSVGTTLQTIPDRTRRHVLFRDGGAGCRGVPNGIGSRCTASSTARTRTDNFVASRHGPGQCHVAGTCSSGPERPIAVRAELDRGDHAGPASGCGWLAGARQLQLMPARRRALRVSCVWRAGARSRRATAGRDRGSGLRA